MGHNAKGIIFSEFKNSVDITAAKLFAKKPALAVPLWNSEEVVPLKKVVQVETAIESETRNDNNLGTEFSTSPAATNCSVGFPPGTQLIGPDWKRDLLVKAAEISAQKFGIKVNKVATMPETFSLRSGFLRLVDGATVKQVISTTNLVDTLSVKEKQEEAVCRALPFHQLTESNLRRLITDVLSAFWSHDPEGQALPQCSPETAAYESFLVLEAYKKAIERLGDLRAVDAARFSLLYIRLRRLRDYEPVAQHLAALAHTTEVLQHHFEYTEASAQTPAATPVYRGPNANTLRRKRQRTRAKEVHQGSFREDNQPRIGQDGGERSG